jgi:hypothetical protein
LIRAGIFCTIIAIVVGAFGILSIVNVIPGGTRGIYVLLLVPVGFGFAGYFFWAGRWLRRHPQRLQQAASETVIRSRLQRKPDERP